MQRKPQNLKIKIKSALRGSEKTAPNILFKKLNIIYKSLFHKQLFLLYISTWKSFYKGDNFSTRRNTSKDWFYPISMILLSRHWGNAQSCSPDNLGASRSAVFDSSQVNPLAGPDEYPGEGGGCWVYSRAAKAMWLRAAQERWKQGVCQLNFS